MLDSCYKILGATQVLRNTTEDGVAYPSDTRVYGTALCSITRAVVIKFPEKKHYVKLQIPSEVYSRKYRFLK